MKALTKRKPRRCGEIKSIGISEMEKIEYRQTGMIKVKDTHLSFGELSRLNYEYIDYYDWCEKQASKSNKIISLDELWDLMD